VVDPGFMVDSVDWGTPDQPHNPDQPPDSACQSEKQDKPLVVAAGVNDRLTGALGVVRPVR